MNTNSAKLKIVVADGYTVNPGDISWAPLEALGDCVFYDRTAPDQVVPRCSEADIVITSKVAFTADLFDKLPKLKYIGVIATGYNVVDIEAANAKGVVVTNVPDYCTAAVAQMVFALVFELCRRTALHNQSVKAGDWTSSPDFCYWKTPQMELNGKTMGLIGFGHIGQAVTRIALAIGMRVIASVRTPKHSDAVGFTTQRKVFETSDIISLHCPLTPATHCLINAGNIAKMKSSAIVINTSRGPLVNDKELADALNHGRIAGAGLDVLTVEPPSADNPLLKAKNCVITPHIAWASRDARMRLIEITAANIQNFLRNAPANVVS